MQDGPAELQEGQHDDGEERHQRQEDDGPAIDRRRRLQAAPHLQDRRRLAGVGGEAARRQEAALHQQNPCRHQDQQHAQHARRGGVGRGFADEELEGLDGEDRHVLGQHEGHAEILQGLDEDQQGARQHRRQHDGQGHGPHGAARRGAQALRGLFHGDVDRLEGGDGGQQDVGIERERIDQHDAARAIDRAEAHAPRLKPLGDDARASEQQDDGIGADEGRKHKRQGGQSQDRGLAGDGHAGQREGEGHGEQRGDRCRREPDPQRVQDGGAVERPAEHFRVVGQRELLALGIEQAGAEDVEQGVEQEETQEEEAQGRDGERQALAMGNRKRHGSTVRRAGS